MRSYSWPIVFGCNSHPRRRVVISGWMPTAHCSRSPNQDFPVSKWWRKKKHLFQDTVPHLYYVLWPFANKVRIESQNIQNCGTTFYMHSIEEIWSIQWQHHNCYKTAAATAASYNWLQSGLHDGKPLYIQASFSYKMAVQTALHCPWLCIQFRHAILKYISPICTNMAVYQMPECPSTVLETKNTDL